MLVKKVKVVKEIENKKISNNLQIKLLSIY